MKYCSALLLMVFSTLPLFPQFFEYGQEPASVNWKYADTENFRLIFPSGWDENTSKILWLLEKSYAQNAEEFNHRPKKIPVVIHNLSVVSNGFVAWAPKRMELFPHPDPKGYSGDRFRQLTLHEMRHVMQIDKLNQGFTRVLSTFTGEQGNGLAAGMLPMWVLEGDAILAETGHTLTGRGRLPSFEKELKALLADKPGLYSYDKSYFGSYRDFVPDYYRYGFQIAAHARYKYGEDFWPEAVKYTGRNSWLISPLTFYIKKETGLTRSEFHREAIEHIMDHWKNTSNNRKIQHYTSTTGDHKVYTSYRCPHIMEDSSVIALKSGLDILPSFVRIHPDKTEKKLFTPGPLHSGRISIKGNKMVWDEYSPDPRWGNRTFSVIRILDFEAGGSRYLTKNSRYNSPVFSTSGDTIAAIETDTRQQTFLVLLSTETGHYYSKSPSPNNAWLQYPSWINGSSCIAVITSDDTGKKIVVYDTNNDTWKTVFYAGFHDIHELISHEKYLIFRGTFSGIDDIYTLDTENGKLYRITYSGFGAFDPNVSSTGKELSFSEYTRNGYKPVRMDFNDSLMVITTPEKLQANEQTFFTTRLIPEEDLPLDEIPEEFNPEIKNYSRVANLFRFHSWVPFYIDYQNIRLENPEINPGFSLTSQNILSTAFTSLGYEYNDKDHIFHTSFTYKGSLPVISLSSRYGGTPKIFRSENNPQLTEIGNYQYLSLITHIPLSFSSGKYVHGIQPILKINYSGDYFYYQSEGLFRKGMIYTEPRLYLYSYLRRAYRDIQPRTGYIMDVRSLSTPFEKEQLGIISSLRATVFLPGLLKNHGLKIQAQFQKQNTPKYLYNNMISFARGYDDLISIGLQKYSADYIFPLLYPDIRIASLLYLKRIHLNLFWDYLLGKDVYEKVNNESVVSDKTLQSMGIEIYSEYHFMRFLFPFLQGIRISWLPEMQGIKYEGIFKIDLGRF